jgi:competence protein ComEA
VFQFSRGQQVLLVVLLAAILSGAAALLYTQGHRSAAGPVFSEPEAQPAGRLMVHVGGAVKRPGVYSLRPGSRVQDAVREAGGASRDALLDEINLAAFVQDGEKVTIPSRQAELPAPAPTAGGPARPATARAPSPDGARPARISLNKSSADDLEDLPGIGPVYARKIVELRQKLRSENGSGYTSVEQLRQIPGIGPKRFDRIKPLVTL